MTPGSSTSYPLIGNLSKGVSSESANVVARWPSRKSLSEAQSLKPRPILSSGLRSAGIAKAPKATTGVSFSNWRRFIRLNFFSSMNDHPGECGSFLRAFMGFAEYGKVTAFQGRLQASDYAVPSFLGLSSRSHWSDDNQYFTLRRLKSSSLTSGIRISTNCSWVFRLSLYGVLRCHK